MISSNPKIIKISDNDNESNDIIEIDNNKLDIGIKIIEIDNKNNDRI